MIKLLKSKAGMTLTELLVSMVVFSIIAAAATAVLGPILNAFGRANDLAEINMLLDSLVAEIESDISYATGDNGIEHTGGTITIRTNVSTIRYWVDGNNLLRREVNGDESLVLHEWYYRGKGVQVLFTGFTGHTPGNITLTLLERDGVTVITSRDYAASPPGWTT